MKAGGGAAAHASTRVVSMRGLRVEASCVDGADASGKRRGEEGNNELMMDGRGMCHSVC